MQPALILGAGGFGREVLSYARASGEWDVVGFLDANPRALDGFDCPVSVLGDPLTVDLPAGVFILCAIGDPKTRLFLSRNLKQRGARLGTLIHPTAIVGPSCQVGEGSTLCPFSILTSHVRVGDFVVVNLHSSIGHDAIVGDGCTLSAHCDVTGGVTLGEGVFMGSRASVAPRIHVGDYAVIGAGSVAMWPVRAHSTVLGVPAVRIATATGGAAR